MSKGERKISEATLKKNRERTARLKAENPEKYYASIRKYYNKTVLVQVRFNKETEQDLLSLFDLEKPLATQAKDLLKELIRLRETQRLWKKAAAVLMEDNNGGETA